jgi:hypothetical protein
MLPIALDIPTVILNGRHVWFSRNSTKCFSKLPTIQWFPSFQNSTFKIWEGLGMLRFITKYRSRRVPPFVRATLEFVEVSTA